MIAKVIMFGFFIIIKHKIRDMVFVLLGLREFFGFKHFTINELTIIFFKGQWYNNIKLV